MTFATNASPRLLLVGSLAVFAVACAPAGTPPSASASTSGAITATVSEWKIDLSSASAPAGAVTFAVSNTGAIAHEFLVIRTDMMAGSMPVRDNMIDFEAMGGPMSSGGMGMPGMSAVPGMAHPVGTVGVIEQIAAGASDELVLENLVPGHYAIVCDLPAHYQQGMHADFTVR